MASPLLRHFAAETSNAYATPSPAVWVFVVDAGGEEDTPLVLQFTAETSNAYLAPSPAVHVFSVDMQNFTTGDARLHGKQLVNASVAASKLASGTLYVKADGTVPAAEGLDTGGFKLTNVGTPSAAADILTKAQLDAFVLGAADHKSSARAVAAVALPANTRTSNTLTASANGSFNATGVDGVTNFAPNDRVLVAGEAIGANRGLFRLSDLGSAGTPWVLVRVDDMNTDAETTAGAAVTVLEGTSYAGTRWVLTTNDPITLNTTSLTFSQVTGLSHATAGGGLTKTGDVLDVGAGDGIQANPGDLQVLASAIAGTNLEADGYNNLRISASAAGDGLDGGATLPLSVSVADLVGVGISDDLANNFRIAAPGNGLTGGNGSPLAVLPNGLSIEATSSGLKAAVPVRANKAANPSVTTGNGQTSGVLISFSPSGGYVRVRVNGRGQELGDGVKTKDCYFSVDSGTTARAISAIAVGDTLYWNGTIAGFNLATTDEVDLEYSTII